MVVSCQQLSYVVGYVSCMEVGKYVMALFIECIGRWLLAIGLLLPIWFFWALGSENFDFGIDAETVPNYLQLNE